MHDGWMSWGHGYGSGMLIGPIIWIAIIAFGIWAVLRIMRSADTNGSLGSRSGKTPREILDARFASGEIDREEYLRRRELLESR